MDLINPLTLPRARQWFAVKRRLAKCLVTDLIGDCVHVRGDSDLQGNYLVERADPTNPTKMPAVGIILEKTAADTCWILSLDEMDVSGLTPSRPLFVGLDGRPTHTTPDWPATRQNIGIALSSTKAFLSFDTTDKAMEFRPTRLDLLDNSSAYLIVGAIGVDTVIEIDYMIKLPVSGRSQSGVFTFLVDAGAVELDHEYVYRVPEIHGLTFSASSPGGSIRLNIVTTGVGENPILFYQASSTL